MSRDATGEVTQADREAFIDYEKNTSIGLNPTFCAAIRAGDHDADRRIQAFARHREAHRTAASQASAGEEGLREILVDHFPTGLRGSYERTAGGIVVDTGMKTDCHCGWSAQASDEHEVRDLWARHVAATLSPPTSDAGERGKLEHHCSEEDGPADVGLLLHIGDNEALWIGEITSREAGDFNVADVGWHIVHHRRGEKIHVAFVRDNYSATDLMETLAEPLSPPTSGEEMRLREALRIARQTIQIERNHLVDCCTVNGDRDTLDEGAKPDVDRMEAALATIDTALNEGEPK